ncbi:hypothetical protein J2Y49_004451 [Azospirillum sp. BE72]|nr:hypothetical protein [Azospirillum sp. BE72]
MRSERQLIKQLDYNLLFRWFVGLSTDASVWDVTVFIGNCERLLAGDVAAKLANMGHALMENRHAPVVDVRLTAATGLAKRAAAASMVEAIPGRHRITVGADKANDPKDFVANLRSLWPDCAKRVIAARPVLVGCSP